MRQTRTVSLVTRKDGYLVHRIVKAGWPTFHVVDEQSGDTIGKTVSKQGALDMIERLVTEKAEAELEKVSASRTVPGEAVRCSFTKIDRLTGETQRIVLVIDAASSAMILVLNDDDTLNYVHVRDKAADATMLFNNLAEEALNVR